MALKGEDGSLGATCGLLIIDEVHLLADKCGASIESVVARLHRWMKSSQPQVRLVGLSATLPKYKDDSPVSLQRSRCLATAPSR